MKLVHAASWDEIAGHIIDGRALCMDGAHRAPTVPGESQGSPREPMTASMELIMLSAAPLIIPPQCQLEPLAPPLLWDNRPILQRPKNFLPELPQSCRFSGQGGEQKRLCVLELQKFVCFMKGRNQ